MTLRLASSAWGNHTDMINQAKRMLVDQIISAKRSNINIHLQWVDIWLKNIVFLPSSNKDSINCKCAWLISKRRCDFA